MSRRAELIAEGLATAVSGTGEAGLRPQLRPRSISSRVRHGPSKRAGVGVNWMFSTRPLITSTPTTTGTKALGPVADRRSA